MIYAGYVKRVVVDGKKVNVTLWDPAGVYGHDAGHFWHNLYQESAVVVICFALDNQNSLQSVMERWYPEVRHFCVAPILLVGCKSDLRRLLEGTECIDMSPKVITSQDALLVATEIQAAEYLECSAMKGDGITEVIGAAVRISDSWDRHMQTIDHSTCRVL